MKKMLSLVLVSVILGLGIVAQADTWVANTAKNQRGEEVHPDYGGYETTRIAGGGVAGQVLACTGRCVLAGLIPTTGGAGTLVYIYDTSVAGAGAGTTNERLKLTWGFTPVSTSPTVAIPKPIRFTNGIVLQLSSVAASEAVTVLYVDLDQR